MLSNCFGHLHSLRTQCILGCIECMRCRLLLPMIAVSVCQSVCYVAQLGFTVQKWLN